MATKLTQSKFKAFHLSAFRTGRKKSLQKGVQKASCVQKDQPFPFPFAFPFYCTFHVGIFAFAFGYKGPDRTGSLLLPCGQPFYVTFFHVGIVHMLFLLLFVRFFFCANLFCTSLSESLTSVVDSRPIGDFLASSKISRRP